MKRYARMVIDLAVFGVIGLLVAVLSCRSVLGQNGPSLMYGVRPGYTNTTIEYPQPDLYEGWWHEIADCESLPLPPQHSQVRFFALSAREFWPLVSPGWAIGYAMTPRGEILLAFPYIADPTTVKHEMLHFLLYWNHETKETHPIDRFGVDGIGMCGVVPYRRPGIEDK